MMTRLMTGKRMVAVLVMATLVVLSLALTALADGITGYLRYAGPGRIVFGTMNGVLGAHRAGTLVAEIGGQNVGTFCTDIEHPIYQGEAFVYAGPATCQVAWLVSRYPPLLGGSAYPDSPPTPALPNRHAEMAARQSAVWYFSDGFVLNSGTSRVIRNRAQEIIASVPNPCQVTLETPELAIAPADLAAIYPDQSVQLFTLTATQGGQPLAGLVVALSIEPASGFTLSDAMVTTGGDGSAGFTVTANGPGSVQISAEATFTLPGGTMFSPVDGVGQRLVLGEPTPGAVFAEATVTWVPGGTIVAHVFHDHDMNGLQDAGEEALPGWTVALYDGDGVELASGLTAGGTGNYLFGGPDGGGLAAGGYRVDLTAQAGYQRTSDAQVLVELEMGGHGVANFGVIRLPAVRACTYEDLNENGNHDEGEAWLSGWEMQLHEGDDNSAVISAHGVTGADGCAVLSFFDSSYYEEGTPYYVGQTLRDGWFNVSPITQSFSLEPTEVETVTFGNVQPEPAISLEKRGPAYARAGDSITYTFAVTNAGNVRLTGAVSDPMLPDLVCSFAELAPGESHVCEASYVVPQGPDDPLLNSASVSAQDAYGHSVIAHDDHSVDVITPDDDTDSDGDGIPDQVEGDGDADGDGVPNYLDDDSDGDGIPDATEGAGDADSDGTPNFLDLESDGDGIPDSIETADDANGDDVPNFLNLDSDGDGIPDAGEWSMGADDPLAGCHAADPACFDNDADDDGTLNYLDADSDGDGLPDAEEGLKDSDEDGIPDWLDAGPGPHEIRYYLFLPTISNGH